MPGYYDTTAGVPTKGSEFAQLIEHLRKAQEHCAMISHLTADNDKLLANGWLAISDMLKKTEWHVTKLATKGLQ